MIDDFTADVDAVNQFGSRQIEAGGLRDSVFSSNSQSSLRPVLHHFRQLSSIDVVEIPEDVYMLRCSGMGTNESRIPFQLRFIIFNADTPSVIDIGDVGMLLPFIRVDNAVGCEGSRTAIGMVHHHDVLNAEQMLRDCDGA